MADDDDLTVTPLDRAVRRAALYRTQHRLAKLSGRRLQNLRTEIRHTQIAHYVEALLAFGVTEDRRVIIKNLEEAILEAADKFEVHEKTAWTAWRRSRTHLNDPRKRRNVAKPKIRCSDRRINS